MTPFAPGSTLHGRFALRERIGAGGMSEVWRAEDEVLGRPVAVKALAVPLAADPVLRAATWREARAAAKLAHPHVTQVYDYGEAPMPGGAVLPYLVMELVDGESLADRLRAGPLPWPEAARIGAQVAAALSVAHGLGIVHRDIKPGNVMLTAGGAKVLDFGIAALAGGSETDGGRIVGTPAYAAPERLRGAPVAPPSDVYALGVLLYEALTGHPPVPAGTWQDAAEAHRSAAPVAPLDVPGLPRRIARLCLACLDPDPAERPAAAEMAAALAAAAGQPVDTSRQPPDGTAVLPPVAAPPPGAEYAVGSAPLPHPPTLIEPAIVADYQPEAVPPRHDSRRLLFGLLAVVAALVLALAAVTSALLSDNSRHNAAPGPGSSSGASAAPSPPAQTPSPASSAPVIDQLNQTVTDALTAGRIDSDTAKKLRDDISNLSGSGQGKVRKQVQSMKRTIDELVHDDKLDQATADRLNTLLDSLNNNGDTQGND
jgi:eukaryotic-like serine/threonine-protein kinase